MDRLGEAREEITRDLVKYNSSLDYCSGHLRITYIKTGAVRDIFLPGADKEDLSKADQTPLELPGVKPVVSLEALSSVIAALTI